MVVERMCRWGKRRLMRIIRWDISALSIARNNRDWIQISIGDIRRLRNVLNVL